MKKSELKQLIKECIVELNENFWSDASQKFINQGADAEVVGSTIDLFKKLKDSNKLPKDFKDISAINDFNQLKNIVQSVEKSISKTAEKKQEKLAGAKLIYSNNQFVVIQIFTHAASCKYGAGTRWCTTEKSPGNFNSIIDNGNLFYIIDKSKTKDGLLYKVAIVVSDKLAAYNAKDDNIDAEKYLQANKLNNLPELKPDKLWFAKKHIKNGTVNSKNEFGETSLQMAAWRGHKEVVDLFLAHGADVNAKDDDGRTPLHWAAWNGHKDVAELLLAHGADVNAKADDGWTSLHRAAVYGRKDVAELLLTHGADVNAKDSDGWTPLHCAIHYHYNAVADLLRAHGGK